MQAMTLQPCLQMPSKFGLCVLSQAHNTAMTENKCRVSFLFGPYDRIPASFPDACKTPLAQHMVLRRLA